MSDDPPARDSRDETPPPPAWFRRTPRGPLGWIVIFSRAMIFDQHLRRVTMFYLLVAAMLIAFGGDAFFSGWLRQHLLYFAIYLLACGWLTILAALLAIYDLLMLRVQHRLLRRKLRERILGEDVDKKMDE